jgi:hypothetical protein
VNIVPYRQWSDVTPRGTPSAIRLPAPRLWLHHGASGTSTVATARAYARFHIVTQGWTHVGYSFLVAGGQVLEGRGPGRAGAHTAGDNTGSHGICLVGDYTNRTPAPADLDALRWLLLHGHAQGWWPTPTFTGGHRDAPGASTSCPGTRLWPLIPSLNSRPTPAPPVVEEDEMAEAVEGIQRTLNAAGFRDQNREELVVDGKWGPKTETALRNMTRTAMRADVLRGGLPAPDEQQVEPAVRNVLRKMLG